MITLNDLSTKSRELDLLKVDIVGREVAMEPSGRFLVGGRELGRNIGHIAWNAPSTTSTDMTFEDAALTQLFEYMSRAYYPKGSHRSLPQQYMMALPAEFGSILFNHHVASLGKRDSDLLFRIYENQVRAVVHRDYPRIWNTDIIEIVEEVIRGIEEHGGQYEGFTLGRAWVDHNWLYIPFHFDSVHTGDYYVGGVIRHAENGTGGLQLISLVQVTRCTNSIIRIDNATNIRHTQYLDTASLMGAIVNELPRTLHASGELALKAKEAEEVHFPNFSALLDGISEELKLTHEQKSQMLLGTGNEHTLAGAVAGVTFMAHQSFTDPHKRFQMESYGGQLLTSPVSEFERLIKKGSELVRVSRRGERV